MLGVIYLTADTPGFWSVPPEEPLPKDRKGKSKTKLHPLNVPTVYNMRRLADYLRAGGMNNVQPVSFATTPIVKFQTWSNIQCDITVNDLGGWYVILT